MTATVNLNALQKAEAAWGVMMPEWVRALAEEAVRTNMAAVAKRIGYSTPVVSNVIANKYKADLAAVETRVRGALLAEEVDCPILGDIRKDRCIDEQKKDFIGTSALRTRLHKACRGGCPHSRVTKGGKHAAN